MGKRLAHRAAAGSRVADEIGDVGPMRVFDDAPAAVRGDRLNARRVNRVADEAGVRPFPDVAGTIAKSVLVDAEAADRTQAFVVFRRGAFRVIFGEPAIRQSA